MPEDTDRLQALFDAVAADGFTSAEAIHNCISECGLSIDDHRLRTMRTRLQAQQQKPINQEAFTDIVRDELLTVSRIVRRQLVVPDWPEFCQAIRRIYDEVAPDRSGENANYIPILRDADPEKWGVALCSVDGQRFCVGDVDVYHSIQSVSKPLTYAHALCLEGEEFTHSYVGMEPSGRPFNDLSLLPDLRPFNPCVNAGAIMIAGIVASGSPDRSAREITQDIIDLWTALCGGVGEVRFSEETMLSERATAHNNFAIAYLLQGRKGLPRNVDLHKTLDIYLSCCSIEMTASMLSVAAATLANGGVCPVTGVQVLPTELVKRTLAVMQFAGMYDNAGAFTFSVGLPAKSGVAGAVMAVVPNLMGFATFSPRLDAYGNSVRGVAFCRQLVDRFTFHVYDSLSGGRTGCKQDPRESQRNRKHRDLSDLRWALSYGDRYASKVRDLALTSMIDICLGDGDVEDSELAVIGSTLEDIVGSPIAVSELESLARDRQAEALATAISPFEGLLARLAQEHVLLDDNARELILESAFRVACADGEVEPQEHERLLKIAEALAIHAGVLQLEIDRFQRKLAKR